MAAGIRQRHGRTCKGGRCKCPWEAFVYSKRDGKKIRKAFPQKAEAVSWRDDAKPQVRNNLMRSPTTFTIEQAAWLWLEGARTGTVRNRSGHDYKPSAIRSYAASLRLRVLPEFGSVRLADLEQADLQQFVERLRGEGLSASAIGATLNPLRAIYKQALKHPRTGIRINPTANLELPTVTGRRERVASPNECGRLLTALRAADRPVWATAMYAGLRRGELQALRVEDIDLGAGVIHVRGSWDPEEGAIATKSRKARKVPIPAPLRDYLDEHLLQLGWREGLVFGVTASSPFPPVSLVQRAQRAWKASKLNPIAPHECRHTYASLMIAAGVNANALKEYMGHANIGITMDLYGHLLPGNESEAASLLDAYLDKREAVAVL